MLGTDPRLRHVLGYLFAQAKLGIYSGEPGEPTVAGELTAIEGDLEGEVRLSLKAGR